MKKIYEAPKLATVVLDAQDIVRTSDAFYQDKGGDPTKIQFGSFEAEANN